MKHTDLLAKFTVFLKGKTLGFPNWIIMVLVLGMIGNCQPPVNRKTPVKRTPEVAASPVPTPSPSPIETRVKPTNPVTKTKDYEVRLICKKLAESHAISPIGIKHSLTKPEYVESTGIWVYRGHIDAQNAFGATIRNNYNCGVKDETQEAVIEFVSR